MSILFNLVNFLSFLSGIVFGVFVCFVAVVHFLSDHTKKTITKDELNTPPVNSPAISNAEVIAPVSASVEKIQGSSVPQKLSKGELTRLNEIINFLDELNSPFKNIKPLLERIHANKDQDLYSLATKMKTIIENPTVNKLEKEFQDTLNQLKDHSKQVKSISSFLNELAKVFLGFSRDVSKVSNTARNNMHKSSQSLDRKEDMIANNWWQTLQIALDSIANDQEDLSTIISEELISYSNQIQEEISIIEKRLSSEGNKQFSNLREQLNVFELRLKERDKTKEKLKNTPIQTTSNSNATGPSESYQRRAQRLKASEDALTAQTKKLYEAQKEFYQMLPKIYSDVQLTIVKSIVETQSQLLKLTESIDRIQGSHKSICSRMKTQLTNAASSLVQMIREDSCLLPAEDTSSDGASIALQIMKQRMRASGVKGFELTLQHVLEGLMLQSQLKEAGSNSNAGSAKGGGAVASSPVKIPVAAYFSAASDSEDLSSLHIMEDLGKLDMFQEATAYLAASNPFILPELPRTFRSAIATETCVWFNAFSGRVYRDISNSDYFHRWFCLKVAQMLNKKRPDYIDQFEVIEVTFGELPPLLLNMKWSPLLKKRDSSSSAVHKEKGTESVRSESKDAERSRSKSSEGKTYKREEEEDRNSDSEASLGDLGETEYDEEEEEEGNERKDDGRDGPETQLPPRSSRGSSPEDNQFYAACTADVAFRSGLKFTVSTKLWINWPRDRYASVPVMFYVDLAELVGRIRFGVERSHSFLTFLGDPTTRISVRSEVGGDKYKLKDIPQVSDWIVKKMKKIIHRRLVYPHAHKFRLIWPRNWWPEGTENLFLPTEQSIGPSSRPSSPVPLPRAAEVRTPSTATASASVAPSETGSSDSVPASKQLMDKLMTKARAFNFTSSLTSAAQTTPPPPSNQSQHVPQHTPPSTPNPNPFPVSNPASAAKTSEATVQQPGTIPPPGQRALATIPGKIESKPESVSLLSPTEKREMKWLNHLKELLDQPASSSLSISELDKRRLLQQFYLKQRKKKNNEEEEEVRDRRRERSLSIADFRRNTVDLVLEGFLDRLQSKILDAVNLSGRASLVVAVPEPVPQSQPLTQTQTQTHSQPEVIRASRESSLPNVYHPATNARHPPPSSETATTATTGGGGGGWFSAKGKEAKAKLLEFKNKHFGQGKQTSAAVGGGSSSHGLGGKVSSTDESEIDVQVDKAYKSAAKFGGKLKDLFHKMQDEFSTAEPGLEKEATANRRKSGLLDEEGDRLNSRGRPSETTEDLLPRSADVGVSKEANLKESTRKFMSSMFGSRSGGGGGDFTGEVSRMNRAKSMSGTDSAWTKESRANSILTKVLASPSASFYENNNEAEAEEVDLETETDKDS